MYACVHMIICACVHTCMCAHVEQSGPMNDGNMNAAMVEHEVHDETEAVYDQSALLFRERPMILANDELCVRVDTNERINRYMYAQGPSSSPGVAAAPVLFDGSGPDDPSNSLDKST